MSRPPKFLVSHRWVEDVFKPLSPKETIAACFCGPAKSTALGIPLLYAMWAPLDLFTKAKTSVPVLLYTTEQICVAHFFVQIFRKWSTWIEKREGIQHARGDSADMDMTETPAEYNRSTVDNVQGTRNL